MPEPTAFHEHDHAACRDEGLAHAEEIARARKLRLTPVRRRTLEILLERHRALGAYEVLERLAEDGFGSQPPVAYRALEFLVENGLAHRIQRLNAYTACAHPGEDHSPVFLICSECKSVAEAPAQGVLKAMSQAAQPLGFAITQSNIEAVGTCPACAEAVA
ncbi:Zinc uptake regulation protein [Pseudoruegeria aquimaris]|uniref:Zinc uptake regulation protein n=1 Tax=Pseudoruegeria aquimaris TaxID=393663 RepID=A0A1Y5TCB0_9RHOB|nr:transcriptional repressor [Pseudoruegeria aquimaris]SLN60810.1 Zinc uptake regulation protein [Pseudoruegeria aquimaris]